MSGDLEIIQLAVPEDTLKICGPRKRNQLIGCMHAHNELTTLNRLLMFSMNRTGDGELNDSANSVQMWTLLQVLAGKLYETWNMLTERFLKSQPQDAAVAALSAEHQNSLRFLAAYFEKENSIRIVRDKTAFHYDKFELEEPLNNIAAGENNIYLARHPANALYYFGSSLVFRGIFSMIAKKDSNNKNLPHDQLSAQGFYTTVEDIKQVNWHLHLLLYGLIKELLGTALDGDQTRITVKGAPDPELVGLPTFVDMGAPSGGKL